MKFFQVFFGVLEFPVTLAETINYFAVRLVEDHTPRKAA